MLVERGVARWGLFIYVRSFGKGYEEVYACVYIWCECTMELEGERILYYIYSGSVN